MAIKVPIVSEFNSTGLVQANTALAKFGVTSTAHLKKAAAGFGLLAVGAAKAFKSLDAGYDAIVAGTGATGAALDKLKDSAKSVAREVPNSFEEVGTAIAEVNTRLGLTGKPLEDMTVKFLNLARVTGGDVKQTIADTTRVFGDWAIAVEDQSVAMDKLLTASQATGIGLDRLSTQVVTFGAPLRQMGFSFEEATALLSKFEKEGVNADAVLAGMKIGLNNLAKAGEEPADAFRRLVTEIAGMENAADQIARAGEVFGTRAGADLAAAIDEGRFSIDELVASLGDAEGALDTAAEATLSANDRMKMLGNQLLVAVEPAVVVLEKALSALITVFTSLPGPVQTAVVVLGLAAVAAATASHAMQAFGKSAIGAKVASSGFGVTLGAVAVPAMVAFSLNARKNTEDAKQYAEALEELGSAADEELGRKVGAALIAASFAGKDLETTFKEMAQSAPGAIARMLEMEDASGGLTEQLIAEGVSTKDAADWVDKLRSALGDQKVAVDNATKSQEAATAALGDNAAALSEALSGVEDYTKAQGLVETAIRAAILAEKDGSAALRRNEAAIKKWVGDAGVKLSQASGSFAKFTTDVETSAAEYRAELVENAVALFFWQENLLKIAEETSAEFAASFAEIGAGSAGVVSELANDSVLLQGTFQDWTLYTAQAERDMGAELAKIPAKADTELGKLPGIGGGSVDRMVEAMTDSAEGGYTVGTTIADRAERGLEDSKGRLKQSAQRIVNDVINAALAAAGSGPGGQGAGSSSGGGSSGGGGGGGGGSPTIPASGAYRPVDQPRGTTGGGVSVTLVVQSGAIVTPNDIEQWARTELAPIFDRINREQGRHNG